jgi:putative addiction module CopG family antidote
MTTEQIHLSEEQAAFVREVIASGQYRDIDEVVRVSVYLLKERLAQEEAENAQLRDMLERAKASGVSDRSAREVWDAVAERYRTPNA